MRSQIFMHVFLCQRSQCTINTVTRYHNYFDIHVCLSLCVSVRHTLRFPIPAVVSQIKTNRICLVCLESKEYPFWVTLRSPSFMRRGKAELRT